MASEQAGLDLTGMNGEIRVPITDKRLIAAVTVWMGLKLAIRTLEESKLGKDLAGMQLALTILRKEEAEEAMAVHRHAMPMLARVGVDLGAWAMHRYEGIDTIVCKPLADRLEETLG